MIAPSKSGISLSSAVSGPRTLLFATLMTLTAGFVNSVGYVQLGGLYLSFMSGNTTRMGVAIAAENVETAIHAACIIALFVLGAGIGTAIGDRANRFMAPIVYLAETSIFGMVLVGSRVGLGASFPFSWLRQWECKISSIASFGARTSARDLSRAHWSAWASVLPVRQRNAQC